MKCPYCGFADSKVVDSRDSENSRIRRRRECLKCEKRFTTYEYVELDDLTVVKKNGAREQFDRQKLVGGMSKACEKCSVSREQVEAIADDVERVLRAEAGAEVSSRRVGDLVMERLRTVDKVAYIRFASVYQEFKSEKDFELEARMLMAQDASTRGV